MDSAFARGFTNNANVIRMAAAYIILGWKPKA